MTEEQEERRERAIAFEKRISEIQKDDIRVKVIGTVVEKDPSSSSILIDDGESTIRIILDTDLFENTELGKLVRAIGTVSPALEGEGFELRGELVQDFSKLDKELYKKYLNLKKL